MITARNYCWRAVAMLSLLASAAVAQRPARSSLCDELAGQLNSDGSLEYDYFSVAAFVEPADPAVVPTGIPYPGDCSGWASAPVGASVDHNFMASGRSDIGIGFEGVLQHWRWGQSPATPPVLVSSYSMAGADFASAVYDESNGKLFILPTFRRIGS